MNLRPEQQTLLDLIGNDGRKIPRFIDTKKETHHHAFLRIQNVFEWLYDLAYPEFLPINQIEIIDLQIADLFKQIKDTTLNKKATVYILNKIESYLKQALETECYESAANFKNYLDPIE